ncbi:DUF1294 domain-containing protein [Mobilitalea sibirica]|uniref:DUF1294 domain-containing protein n=1 Tax=Mobilitalea sibirica TaxID=1462919 RepID=A0A8J7HBR8_9FIRM|nr:DUF1294 domain-containing protein [Mobilitalea sibirica]MBH1939544.1 DUF1294 domain-containing protein [Mobilitalea sibirica]
MSEILFRFITAYLIVINIIGLFIMGYDKQRAIKNKWRVPERTLLILSFIGGGIGTFLGMRLFRHKIKHMKFIILLPMAALFYIVLYFIFLQQMYPY